jgi:hypothetical protein
MKIYETKNDFEWENIIINCLDCDYLEFKTDTHPIKSGYYCSNFHLWENQIMVNLGFSITTFKNGCQTWRPKGMNRVIIKEGKS